MLSGASDNNKQMEKADNILRQIYGQAKDSITESFAVFKFCESDFHFLNGSKNCMVATYNFGSVYIVYKSYATILLTSMGSHKQQEHSILDIQHFFDR